MPWEVPRYSVPRGCDRYHAICPGSGLPMASRQARCRPGHFPGEPSPLPARPLSRGARSDFMSAGLTYRLGRIFGHDGRAMILPVDHGLMLGRIPGLEQPKALVEAAAGAGCDG